MKSIVVMAAVASVIFSAQAAQAEPANFKTQGQLRALCAGFGVFIQPNRGPGGSNGSYGCLMDVDQGGGLYICGPVGDLKEVTCDVYAKAPPHRRGQLPTQTALNAAVKADPSILTPAPHGRLVRHFHPGSGKIQERPE